MKKSQIYTFTGDKGTTSLVGGMRVAKTDSRLDAYGTVDELNSYIGMVVSEIELAGNEAASATSCAFVTDSNVPDDVLTVASVLKQDLELLRYVQNKLFTVGSYLATDSSFTEFREASILQEVSIEKLEKRIDELDGVMPVLRDFILPGGSKSSSVANVARAVCRRAEREILKMAEIHDVDEKILRFINRLSDYLFVLSRACNISANYDEVLWDKTCI